MNKLFVVYSGARNVLYKNRLSYCVTIWVTEVLLKSLIQNLMMNVVC